MLQEFAKLLLIQCPTCMVELDCYAEGYMRVVASHSQTKLEVQIVEREPQSRIRSYGLYSDHGDGHELYTEDVNEIVHTASHLLIEHE